MHIKFVITEGVEGYYIYHISFNCETVSLCGKNVMSTNISFSNWNVIKTSHLNERYCKECTNIMEKMNEKIRLGE